MNTPIYIIAAQRTPIGAFQGSLSSLSAVELGIAAARASITNSGINPEEIDEVIVGNVLSAGLGMGIARQIALGAALTQDTPAYGLNMICGSGMKSVMEACAHIKAGEADIVLSMGTESMSNAGFVQSGALRRGHRLGHIQSHDQILHDGLTDAFHHYHMGITAENIAKHYHISRQAQDQFAAHSQRKAAHAQQHGHFRAEITPINVTTPKHSSQVEHDEHIRPDTTPESLSRLKPAFQENGTVTAGNASGINDGASAIILASADAVERLQLKPLAEIISYGQGGVAPSMMGMGPIPAIAQALERSDYRLEHIERIELNEAFAAQSLGVLQELSVQHECTLEHLEHRTNPSGGAIALGHPLGCSGNRIITTLVHGLRRDRQHIGLAALCIGGGMGTAIIIKAQHA